MNSFNHYSLGAVLEWFYMYVLGIFRDEDAPGYRHFYVKPVPGKEYAFVKGHFETPYGVIRAGWEKASDEDKYLYKIVIPAGASATICIPGYEEKTLGSGEHELEILA